MRILMLLLALAAAAPVVAGWRFAPPLTVAGADRPRIFYHLESAGRRNLAIGAHAVAVAWEDNHTGASQVYVAFLADGAKRFTAPLAVSTGKAAYEPAVAAAPGGGFVLAWEQDGAVWMRAGGPAGLGSARRVDRAESRQATLAGGNRLYGAWVRRDGRAMRLVVAALQVHGSRLRVGQARPVDPKPARYDQLYPTLAVDATGVVAAWEDRREGHTRLYFAHSADGRRFGALHTLNTLKRPRSRTFGRGTGVTRVVLAAGGARRVAAAWMDKRDFMGGYDIYAVVSDNGGESFGPNEKAQDMFGNNMPQWHPAVAVSPSGRVAVAWDDPREDTPDVWLSWRTPNGWSDDLAVPGASGPGAQDNPVMAFDADGRLHMAWVDRVHGGGRIRYAVGRWQPEP
jgi:hypothetical protein